MAHRARILHTSAAWFWLVAALVGGVVVIIAQPGWDGLRLSGIFAGLIGSLIGPLFGSPERDDAPPGARLVPPARTRRSVLIQSSVVVALLVGLVVLLGHDDGDGVGDAGCTLAFVGTLIGLAELGLCWRIVRWERRHPEDLLAQDLGWAGGRRYSWRRVWGDQAPALDEPPKPPPGRTVLVPTGRFWPSRDPDDYR